jgi:serine/threonine-protein kinase
MNEASEANLPRRIDEACDRFEAAWRGGSSPAIEEYLDGWAGPARRELLRELVGLDADYRRRRGEPWGAEQYQGRFPEFDPRWLQDESADHEPPASTVSHYRTGPFPLSGDSRPGSADISDQNGARRVSVSGSHVRWYPDQRGSARNDRRACGQRTAMKITLTVTAGPHKGRIFTFTGHDRFLVGRSKKAHFRLETGQDKDRHVSRFHFMVEVNPPLCRLLDMGSRNGTHVNGQRVTSVDLHHGDEVRVGHTILQVALIDEEGEATGAWDGIFELAPQPPATAPAAAALRPGPPLAPGTPCVACQNELPGGTCPVCIRCRQDALGEAQPIPGYLRLRELGRGAMGVVHLALRKVDETAVALKTIVPAVVARRTQVERFLREANILRQLDHPHIVSFRDMGAAANLFYFAMDHVPGTDVLKLLRQKKRLPVRTAVRLLIQVLIALEYAHGQRFVHRDIKPANILIQSVGSRKVVKLADFGLARVYQSSQLSGLTLHNEMGGTVGYMPPEQITDFRNVSPAADQYSAAATLYHLLSGEYVHDLTGSITTQLHVILHEEAVPLLSRRPELPKPLAAVIHRALEHEPEDRYADVAHFRRALVPFGR